MKKLTQEEYLQRCSIEHNNKYNYNLVEYKNVRTKIKIICPKHGIFEQIAKTHLKCGCTKCQNSDTEEFVNKSIVIHNNKYDYSLVDYINRTIKVKIICPVHGVFEQRPSAHLQKQGCPRCFGTFNTLDFIKRSIEIHGDKYNYSLSNYINGKTKVQIICNIHGVFEQYPGIHLKGGGCNKCQLLTTSEFVNKSTVIHNNKYDYSLVDYINRTIKVKIICPTHGIFHQSPSSHLKGIGCKKCSFNKLSLNTTDFIRLSNEKHNNKYDYSLVDYINNKTKIKIICERHGIFYQRASSHLYGNGCPYCKESKGELQIKKLLDNKNIKLLDSSLLKIVEI